MAQSWGTGVWADGALILGSWSVDPSQAGGGGYDLNGQSVNFKRTYDLSAGNGAFSLVGQKTIVNLSASNGNFSLLGQTVNLSANLYRITSVNTINEVVDNSTNIQINGSNLTGTTTVKLQYAKGQALKFGSWVSGSSPAWSVTAWADGTTGVTEVSLSNVNVVNNGLITADMVNIETSIIPFTDNNHPSHRIYVTDGVRSYFIYVQVLPNQFYTVGTVHPAFINNIGGQSIFSGLTINPNSQVLLPVIIGGANAIWETSGGNITGRFSLDSVVTTPLSISISLWDDVVGWDVINLTIKDISAANTPFPVTNGGFSLLGQSVGWKRDYVLSAINGVLFLQGQITNGVKKSFIQSRGLNLAPLLTQPITSNGISINSVSGIGNDIIQSGSNFNINGVGFGNTTNITILLADFLGNYVEPSIQQINNSFIQAKSPTNSGALSSPVKLYVGDYERDINGNVLFSINTPITAVTRSVGIFSSSNATTPSVINNQEINGALVRVQWNQVETAPGVYNWAVIDNQLSLLQTAKKSWSLAILGGSFSPSWLYSAPYNVSQLNIIFRGAATVVPKFWDSTLQTRLSSLIQAVAARYNSDTSLKLVYVTQMSANGVEGHFNGTSDSTLLSQGFTEASWVSACNQAVSTFSSAFPNKKIAIELHYILSAVTAANLIIQNIANTPSLISHVGIAMWWLSGKTDYQPNLLTSFTNFTGYKFAQLIDQSINTTSFLNGDYTTAYTQAQSLGINYIEAWGEDVISGSWNSLFNNFNGTVESGSDPYSIVLRHASRNISILVFNIASLLSTTTIGSPSLVQKSILNNDGLNLVTSIENASLPGANSSLVVSSLNSTSTSGNASTIQHNILSTNGLIAASTLGNISLSQKFGIFTGSMTSSSSLSNIQLSYNSVSVNSLISVTTIGNAGLTQYGVVASNAAISSSILNNSSLTQKNIVNPNALTSATSLTSSALINKAFLNVDTLNSLSLIGNTQIIGRYSITVNGMTSVTSLDNGSVTKIFNLITDNFVSASTISTPNVVQKNYLNAENVRLESLIGKVITVQKYSVLIDNLNLSTDMGVSRAKILADPISIEKIYTVPAIYGTPSNQ